MKPKKLFMTICIVCAVCVAGCENRQINTMPYEPAYSTEPTLIGNWYWISGGNALTSSTINLTPENTNAIYRLCFNVDSTFQAIENNKIIDSGRFMVELPANMLNLLGAAEMKYEYSFTGNDTISLLEAGIVGTTCTLWIRIK